MDVSKSIEQCHEAVDKVLGDNGYIVCEDHTEFRDPECETCTQEWAQQTKPLHDKSIAELRNEGFAVIVWHPEELNSANPRRVEDRSVELGWEIISDLQQQLEPESDMERDRR